MASTAESIGTSLERKACLENFTFFSWEKWRIAMCDIQLASSNLLNLLQTEKKVFMAFYDL